MHNTYFVISHGLVLQLLGKPLSLDCRVIQLGVGIHNLLLTGEQLEPLREAGHRAVPLGEGTHDLGVVHDEGWVDALNLYEVSHQLWCCVCVCVSFHAHVCGSTCVYVYICVSPSTVYTLSSSLADVLGGLHSTPCFKQRSFKNFWKSKANTHASNTHTFRLYIYSHQWSQMWREREM